MILNLKETRIIIYVVCNHSSRHFQAEPLLERGGGGGGGPPPPPPRPDDVGVEVEDVGGELVVDARRRANAALVNMFRSSSTSGVRFVLARRDGGGIECCCCDDDDDDDVDANGGGVGGTAIFVSRACCCLSFS